MLLKGRSSGNNLMSKLEVVVGYQDVEMSGMVINTVSEK